MQFFLGTIITASAIHCVFASFAGRAKHKVDLRSRVIGNTEISDHNTPKNPSRPLALGTDNTEPTRSQFIKDSELYGSQPLAGPHTAYEALNPETYRDRGRSGMTHLYNDVDSEDVSYGKVEDYGFYKEVKPTLFKPLNQAPGLSDVFKDLKLNIDADAYTYSIEDGKTASLRAINDVRFYPEEGGAVVEGIFSEEDPYRTGKGEEDPKGHTIGLPSSEMLYQGLLKVAIKVASIIASVLQKFRYVLQQHISNQGTQNMISKAFTDLGLDTKKPQRFRLNDPDINEADRAKWNDAFYELAGTDNVRPLIWMARNHRKELGGVVDIYIHIWHRDHLGNYWIAVEFVRAGHPQPRSVDLGTRSDKATFDSTRIRLGILPGYQSRYGGILSSCGQRLATWQAMFD